MSSKKSKNRKPQAPAGAESSPTPAAASPAAPTQESAADPGTSGLSAERAGPAAAPSPSSPWRNRVLLAAALLAIGGGGALAGRASASRNASADTPHPAVTAVASSGLQALESKEPWPPPFELQPDPAWKTGGPELRPMDRDIFDKLITLSLERTQMHDVFSDRPYRVQFQGSLVERRIGTILVDLDRDGTVDERWEIKHATVTRSVPKDPAAGGHLVMYTLSHGRWRVH